MSLVESSSSLTAFHRGADFFHMLRHHFGVPFLLHQCPTPAKYPLDVASFYLTFLQQSFYIDFIDHIKKFEYKQCINILHGLYIAFKQEYHSSIGRF